MLLAFLTWLAEGKKQIVVPMGSDGVLELLVPPVQFSAPVGIPATSDVAETDNDSTEDAEEEFEDEFEEAEDSEEAPDE